MPHPHPDNRQPLQRVPPNNIPLERHLLGAALINTTAAQAAAGIVDAYYKPAHTQIAATIGELIAEHAPTDTSTVANRLQRQGWLDTIGGWPYLNDLVADTPGTASANHWAGELTQLHWQRQQLHICHEVVDAIYRGAPTTGLVAELHRAATNTDNTRISSWEPADLTAALNGEGPDTWPTILTRTDGPALIYPGKLHVLNAEPEAGKSWLCLHACAQQVGTGQHILYIDFEADAGDIVNRLLTLGLTPADILDRFHYIRPVDPLDHAAVARLNTACDTWQPTLTVIDGVTEAMSAAGLSIKDNDDIARFYDLLPRPVARTGSAVVLIDHVVKDKEAQGRWGIGGQHKTAGVDGAVYKLEQITPFARGKSGSSRLLVMKDRHGQVRANATPGANQLAAIVHFTADDNTFTVTVDPPKNHVDKQPFVPTHIMENVSRALAAAPNQTLSKRGIRAAVKGDNNHIDLAIDHLAGRLYIRSTRNGYQHLMDFRADDPDGERYLHDDTDGHDREDDQPW